MGGKHSPTIDTLPVFQDGLFFSPTRHCSLLVNIRPAMPGKHYPTMGGKHSPTIDTLPVFQDGLFFSPFPFFGTGGRGDRSERQSQHHRRAEAALRHK
ncbi:MAG: hypothetical protein WCK35_09255 [Chloroflexota bacterium]